MRFSTTAKLVIAVVVLSMFLLAIGCGSSSSPSAVAEDFVNAVANKDCGAIIDLLNDESQQLFVQEGSDDPVAGCEASIGAEFANQDIVINSFEVTNETQDGDTAQVDFKMSSTVGGEEQSTEDNVKLVKQNGEWKVTLH